MTKVLSLDGAWDFTRRALSTLKRRSIPVKRSKRRKIRVPSNWYLEGEDFAGEALYERKFRAPDLKPGQAAYLRFKGADYFLRAELNGKAVGSHEGYFQTFEFPVTSVLRADNHLKVWVEAPKEGAKDWPHHKHLIKGIFNHHDARPGSWDLEHGQDLNTGGLWGGVELLIADPILLKDLRVRSKAISDGARAQVDLKLTLVNSGRSDDHDIEAEVRGVGFSQRAEAKRNIRLERGQSEVHLRLGLRDPRLWWTWDQGDPNLYEVRVRIRNSRTRRVVEEGSARFGIREVRVTKDWEFFLNGRKFYPRGTNLIPTQWLSEYTRPKIARDVAMMRAANLNAVRVHAHVNRREFYEACDEAGLFVWQDFALQWSYRETPGFVRNACRQIKEMVRHLQNHPSILVWCCHNEPSFNRDTLDPVLARAVREEDDTRFVDVASDFHYHPYPAWYLTDTVLKDAPGGVGPDTRFFSEFGAQALPDLPTLKRMFKPGALWPPKWKKWAFHDFQYFQTFNVAGVPTGRSIKEFIAHSQAHQARVVKESIQTYRLRKYRPMNGYFHFMFTECWPSITWAVVDYFRRPKRGYEALKTASQPVLPVWRLLVERFNPGDTLHWGRSLLETLMVVNDFPYSFKGVRAEVRVVDPRGKVVKREAGNCNLPSDSVVQPFKPTERLNHIHGFILPQKARSGTWRVETRLQDRRGRLLGRNHEEFQVVPKMKG